MEENAANNINYFLEVDASCQHLLGGVRHWSNLKIAHEGNKIWVSGLNYAHAHSIEVRSLPYKRIYYERNGKLFLLNSKLPERSVPALLWTPIERALPVELPSFNHNYFGLHEQLPTRLMQSPEEQIATALIADLQVLEKYLESAASVRLKGLGWTLLNSDKVMILGNPLLPIDGLAFWSRGNSFLPAGYDFEFFSLATEITLSLSPEGTFWVVWNSDNSYFLLSKTEVQPLSRGSLRSTLIELNA